MFLLLFKIRMQAWISAFGRGKDGRVSRGRMLLFCALFIYVAVVFIGMFAGIFRNLLIPVREAGMDWLYFTIGGVMASLLAFVGSVFSVWNQLFDSRDNDALLSMPIKPRAILASRISLLFIINFALSLAMMIPAYVIWLDAGRSAGFISFVLCTVATPFLALAVSTVIGFLIGLAISRVRRKNIFRTVLTVAIFVVYFNFVLNGENIMGRLLGNMEHLAHTAKTWLFPFYHLGTAIAEGSLISTVIFLLCAAVPFVIVVAVVSKAYIGALTMKKGVKSKKYLGGKIRYKSPRKALFVKELRRFATNPMILLNAGLGGIVCIILAVVLVIKSSVFTFDGIALLKNNLGFIAAGILCLISTMNQLSASSISLEGRNLWIIKNVPISTGEILKAKARAHFAYSAATSAFAGIFAVIFLHQWNFCAPFIILMPVIFSLFFAWVGLAVNLSFPNLNWINEVTAVKQGAATLLTMLIGWGSIIVIGLTFLLLSYLGVSAAVLCVIWTVILAAAAYFMRRHVLKKGVKKFEDL